MENKRKKTRKKFISFLSKYWVAILFVLAVLASFFGGFQIYKEEVLHVDNDVKYEDQNTLYFATEKISNFNPYETESEDVYYMSKLLYSYLFNYDENLTPVPEIVDTYKVNTKEAYISFTIKDDVYFSNGDKITSKDVVSCINYAMKQGNNSPYYNHTSRITSCYSRNGKVLVYFRNNYNCSIHDLVLPIINLKNPRIGSGEYYISKIDEKKSITLKPNENYFGNQASKKIVFTVLPDSNLAKTMMDINEVTCYTDDALDRKSTAVNNKFCVYDFPSNNVDFLVFNTSRPYVVKNQVRKALLHAINREIILRDAYMDDGILTDTVYYPNYLGVADTLDSYNFSTDDAVSILKTQGLKADDDGTVKDITGKTFALTILTKKSNNMRVQAARELEKMFESIGIPTTVVESSDEDFIQNIQNKDYDILLTGYSISEEYDLRFLFDGTNEWKYYNENLYSECRELNRIHSQEKYQEKYIKLKNDLIDEAQYYPLCYKNMSLIGLETFEAGGLPMFNDPYKNIETWSWKKILK